MKLVKEHINEKFVEESDPVHDLGVGDKKSIIIDKLDKLAKMYGFKPTPVGDPVNHPYNYFDDNGDPVLYIIKTWSNKKPKNEIEITLSRGFKNKNKFYIGVEYIGEEYCEQDEISFPHDVSFENDWWEDL
jgi:hypothetical protein